MWWRFLTFCVLVTFILFVVLSCIHGRPAIHLFFHRCCEEDIENDQVIFENFGNNFVRERLVGADIVVVDNESFVSEEDVDEVRSAIREKLNVHDPRTRINLTMIVPVAEEIGSSENEETTVKIDQTMISLQNDVKNEFGVEENLDVTTELVKEVDDSMNQVNEKPEPDTSIEESLVSLEFNVDSELQIADSGEVVTSRTEENVVSAVNVIIK